MNYYKKKKKISLCLLFLKIIAINLDERENRPAHAPVEKKMFFSKIKHKTNRSVLLNIKYSSG